VDVMINLAVQATCAKKGLSVSRMGCVPCVESAYHAREISVMKATTMKKVRMSAINSEL
jgi:hypothetical protein